jgi:O-antigen/teichoic acid export membrane protein
VEPHSECLLLKTSRKSKVLSLSLANGALTVVHLISGIVFARVLSPSDYGTYMQTFLAYDFAVPILTLGLPSTLYYFLPGAQNEKRIVLENVLLLVFMGLVFSLFLYLGGGTLLSNRFNNPDLIQTLHWLSLYPLYTFPILAISSVLVVKEKVNVNAIYNVITGLILTLVLIVAALVGKTYVLPTLVRIYLPLLFFPVGIYFIFKYVSGTWTFPQLSSSWNILRFAIPLGVATALNTVTQQLSNIIVSMMSSPEEYAIYAVGARELPIIGIVTGSIATIVMADMSKLIKENNFKEAFVLFQKSATMGALFLLPLMFFLLVYARDFIILFFSEKYINSVIPFCVFLLYLPVRIIMYQSAFIALGKSKAILYRSIVSLLLSVFLCALFMKFWGIIGAAVGTILVSYIWAIPYNLVTIGKAFECKPIRILPLHDIGVISLISIIAVALTLPVYLLVSGYLVRISIAGCCFLLFYCYISYKKVPIFKVIFMPIMKRVISR